MLNQNDSSKFTSGKQNTLRNLRYELDQKRAEIQRCYSIIEKLIGMNDQFANDRDQLEQSNKLLESEKDHLWNEIKKLRHGYDGLAHLKQFHQAQYRELRSFVEQLSVEGEYSIPIRENEPEIKPFKSDYCEKRNIEHHFYCGLDVPSSQLKQDADGMIHIGGWCFDEKGRAPVRVWVVIGKQEIPCSSGWKREDVVKEFSHLFQAELNCGFNVELSALMGVNHINVRAEFASGAEVSLFNRNIVVVGSEQIRKGQLDQDYSSWVRMFDSLSIDDEKAILKHIDSFENKPLISVLLPTYNTDSRWLSEAIESVRKQLYENWELCISDDASPLSHVREILEYYASIDARIKIVIRDENGHISASTNSALELATGEFCALLDHDDVLPSHALYHVANEINNHPNTDLIFSDEDKIDEEGNRFDPYFKSDWNPELFCSHNCISHLGVYRTSILHEIGGFKEELFGSQDWDLAFRFIEKAGVQGIRHIPRVLYHWRYLESSTAMSIESKPYAVTAGKLAIENYLKNRNSVASVINGMWAGSFRVKYHLERPLSVSIIIDTRSHIDCLDRCVHSILNETQYRNFRIHIITANGAGLSNEYGPMVLTHTVDPSLSKPQAYNVVTKGLSSDILTFLDIDTQIQDCEWLEELTSQAIQKETGVVAPWLQYENKETETAGIVFTDSTDSFYLESFKGLPESDIGHMGRAHLIQRFSALSGRCLCIEKTVFDRIKGFNEQFDAFYDFDLCLRIQKELELYCVWTPYARVTSHDIAGRTDHLSEEFLLKEEILFKKEWAGVIRYDPYFNLNLDVSDPEYFLSWPPRNGNPWELGI